MPVSVCGRCHAGFFLKSSKEIILIDESCPIRNFIYGKIRISQKRNCLADTSSKQKLLEEVNGYQEELLAIGHIAQIHEILIGNGIASSEVLDNGDSSELSWVPEYDWFYKTDFMIAQKEEHYILSCKGLDTMCDIFLNGEYLGISESMYLPFEKDITTLVSLNTTNSLVLYFHSHEKMLRYFQETMPEKYSGHVPARAMLLKSEDYGTSPKAGHGYWNIGVFDEVNYIDVKLPGCTKPMSNAWAERLGNFGEEKFGPIHEYYSSDTPESLIYKFTAAASQDIYQMYARTRRGKPHERSVDNNQCQGFMLWKTNDSWPNFYCALVDYYGECSMPHYAVKRAIRPVWIDLETDDRIYL